MRHLPEERRRVLLWRLFLAGLLTLDGVVYLNIPATVIPAGLILLGAAVQTYMAARELARIDRFS